MQGEEAKEKKNKQIALFTSLGIHSGLLLLFFFLVAWRAPNPPLPEYGIELNFGLDEQGGGEIQPEEQPGTEQPVPDEVKPEENKPQEETTEASPTETAVVSKLESPVVIKEEKVVKPVEKPKEKIENVSVKSEKVEVKEPVKEASDTKKGKTNPSQGDDKDKVGNKGNPEGKPDANGVYTKPGGGGGGNGMNLVGMAGWEWADPPIIPDIPDNGDGKIVFEIECDKDGEILTINVNENTLSPKAAEILKQKIRENSLVRTSGGKVPERSKGTIVFRLRTK
jgi:hypothetical protein